MDFNDARWIIREALCREHSNFPLVGSDIAEYEIASVEVMKALNDGGYTVVSKADA